MDPALRALYDRVRDRVSEADFLARVREASQAFEGLLDDEAVGLLVLDEMGLNEGAYVTLGELQGRADATVRVTIERIEPPRTFERAGRDPGRVANVVVSDATGEARIVLWDRDVEKTEDGTLRPGARLTLVNARVKDGRYGVELHVGPWSVLEVEGALDPAKRKLLADVQTEPEGARREAEEAPTRLEGKLAWLAPTRTYRRPDGGVGFATDADIETAKGLCRLVAWDDAVKAVRGIPLGSGVKVEGLAPKTRGAATEWHTTRETRFERS